MEATLLHLIVCITVVRGQPFQYFVTSPTEPDLKEDVYMYAIDPLGSADECQIDIPGIAGCITKEGDIVSGDAFWGRYIRLTPPRKKASLTYGEYNVTFSNRPDCPVEKRTVLKSFVNRRTEILNTDGVWTVTVYRDPANMGRIIPTTIGLKKNKKDQLRYHWIKDGERQYRISGPRYPIESPSDAGVYVIRRRRRAQKGWSVQITVTIASCPEGMSMLSSGECVSFPCANGGVPSDNFRHCTCSNLFDPRTLCIMPYPAAPEDPFVIGYHRPSNECLTCKDLPGGHPTCKGMLFCHGDLYGCKCGSGWRASGCNKPCRKGTWGPSCTLTCPPTDPGCDRFFGPSRENLCEPGTPP